MLSSARLAIAPPEACALLPSISDVSTVSLPRAAMPPPEIALPPVTRASRTLSSDPISTRRLPPSPVLTPPLTVMPEMSTIEVLVIVNTRSVRPTPPTVVSAGSRRPRS